MLATAKHFRERGVPAGVQVFLAQRGIELSSSAIVRARTESYMLGYEFWFAGLVATQDRRFYWFELELDVSLDKVVYVHEYSEMTERQGASVRNRGAGKGDGALAIEVVLALNGVLPCGRAGQVGRPLRRTLNGNHGARRRYEN
ncbi:hypothetical protein [Rubrivivax gelatinosus]|uniref:hypothetical protein n=1 Tax=Rubrivivax gelatinosus TaxID=28068 RepID=UPI0019039810|nr:hypothetical protein [Rubrivivax gelatinosus]